MVMSYGRALSAWQNGDYDRCLRELALIAEDRHTPNAILLRGRALIRAGQLSEAREWLSLNGDRLAGADAQATHAMLTGTAHAQSGHHETAEAYFARARNLNPHHTIVAETCYQQALVRYQLDRMDEARELLAPALRPLEDIICARAQSLLGWIETAQNDHAAALLHFKRALETLARCRAKDAHLQARTLCAIAIAEAELRALDVAWLEAEAATIRWTPSLVCERVQILRHIALMHQRQGNHRDAFARFIEASASAPETAWAVLCQADCSGNALACGERESACAFAANASNLAGRIAWDTVSGEQRLALLALARVLAQTGDAVSAQAYRDLYDKQPGVPSTNALRHDARLQTYERHVEGEIALAQGDTARAVSLLSAAQSAWSGMRYRWRALEAQAALARIGTATASAAAVPAVAPQPARTALRVTARELQIVRLVVAGKGDLEIGRELNLAPRTAKNIVNAMYKQFGVHSRVELIAYWVSMDPTLVEPMQRTSAPGPSHATPSYAVRS
jgi:DNA-binding NarL/FixJ family response regulator